MRRGFLRWNCCLSCLFLPDIVSLLVAGLDCDLCHRSRLLNFMLFLFWQVCEIHGGVGGGTGEGVFRVP